MKWDTDFLSYRSIHFSELYKTSRQDATLFEDNGLIINWNSKVYLEGDDLPDNSVLFSICFQAKKEGQTSVEFIDYLDKDIHSLAEIKNDEGFILDARFKDGNITIEEAPPVCNIPSTNITATICEGDNYSLNNQTYNQSGNYQTAFAATNGCDSIVNLALEVLPIIATSISAQICEGENYILNNKAYNRSGNYQVTLSATNGCDSLVNLDLVVLPNLETSLTAQICEGENYIFNNQTYNQSGNYQVTLSATNGCDSLINLDLAILPILETSLTAQICEGENYILNNQAYNQSGNYQVRLSATNGCDSIVNLDLAVLPIVETSLTAQICEGENYIFNNQTYNQSGNYQVTLSATNGCDSLINLELAVLPIVETSLTAQICEGENYIFNNQTYNQSGNYQATFTANSGCDSIVNLALRVVANINIETTATICEGEFYSFDNQDLTQSGSYQKTAMSANSCDSTVILQLTVLPNYESGFSETICQDEAYLLNNQAYNQSGQYQTIFTAANGCDSMVNLNLTVLDVPTAFPDTVSTVENTTFVFSVLENDILNEGNYEIQLITPPHVGKLTLLEADSFFL